MLGEVLAEAGLAAGLAVSWLPSYGPEMRSGTSNCHVRIATPRHRLTAHLRAQRASSRSTSHRCASSSIPCSPAAGCSTTPPRCPKIAAATTCASWSRLSPKIADELGDSRVGNIVTLGALLEVAGVVDAAQIDAALVRTVKSARWLEFDRKALTAGRDAARQEVTHAIQ